MFVPSYFFISSAIACGRGRPGHGRCTRRPPCVHHLRSLNKEDGSSLLSGILVTSKVTHLGSAVESRERMGSPTLQTHQDPILLLPWLCSRGGGFPNPRYSVSSTLTHPSQHRSWSPSPTLGAAPQISKPELVTAPSLAK
jgi:hypothetical protein